MSFSRFAIGIIVVLTAFALKAGIGLYCGVTSYSNRRHRLLLIAGFGAVYFALFMNFCYLWRSGGLTSKFKALLNFASYGMDIHFLVSIGLIIWGLYLLKSSSHGESVNSTAWIALLVPCPVCMTVIFFTVGFVVIYFPGSMWNMIGISWGFFTGVSLLTFLIIGFLQKGAKNLDLEFLVASTMIVSASYTLLTLLFGAGVKEAPRIYNIVANKELIPGAIDLPIKIGVILICVFLFWGSFLTAVIQQKIRLFRVLKERRP